MLSKSKANADKIKVGARVMIKERGARKAMDNHSSRGKRKCYKGTITHIDGGYIYVRPHWTNWELELYDCEIKVLDK
jgi:hypothetical protein